MMQNHVAILFVLVFVGAEAAGKAPSWFSSFDQKRRGNIIDVTCSGRGPDKALASQTSLNECRGIGVQYVQGYEIKTRSLSIETTKDASWHSESSSSAKVTGLECAPQKQECLEENETWTCYHLCRFDLAKSRIQKQKNDEQSQFTNETDSFVSKAETEPVPSGNLSGPSFSQSAARTLILSTVPLCDDILVVGNSSRVVKCSEIPITLTISDGDREAIARLSGHKPKHLQFTKRKPGSESKPEEVTVYFEK